MKKEDWIYVATMVANLSGIPARLYEGKERIFYHSLVDLPKDPFTDKPLVYRLGRTEINETVWRKTVDEGTRVRRTADVVQIHSAPERTVTLGMRDRGNDIDLTRAMIRY